MGNIEILFWLVLAATVYSYFIYPAVLLGLPHRKHRHEASDRPPSVSLIITAHNEETAILGKLRNSLEIDYPADQFEIIVASDCSTDKTDELVQSMSDRGVRLVRPAKRKGKEYAQLHAIQAARGEILVFSDVATTLPSDSIRRLVDYFQDPRIGAVSSEDRFVSADGTVVGEGLYVKYEMWLRRLESKVGGLVGLSGSFFAARARVCEHWDIESPSDFNTALNSARLGLVAVSAPDVNGYYKDVQDPAREYHRKVRTVIRGITSIVRQPSVLNPWRYGLFAFQIWSHKLMRWAVPWLMLLSLIVNFAVLDDGRVYQLLMLAQLGFYGLTAAGLICAPCRWYAAVKVPFFFVQSNIAIAHATLAFLGGRRMTVWTPSKR